MVVRLGAVAVLALLGACAEDVTQVVIETDTDYVPGVELTRIEWELRSTGDAPFEPLPVVELAPGDEARFPLRLTAVPEGPPDAPLSVRVRAFAGDGSVLVEQTRETRFVPNVSSVLRIELSRLCAGESCATDETCVPLAAEGRGLCLPTGVDASTLPAFREGRPTGVQELCNARDDDGDGVVDNGYDFGSDTAHCGGCFAACAAGPFARATCVEGVCGYECETLRGDCNAEASDGCEADLGDVGTCGDCDVSCAPPTDLCDPSVDGPMASASCVSMCPDGLVPCERMCVDTSSSAAHCGACGAACGNPGPGTVSCIGGMCEVSCNDGRHECDGICLANDTVMSCGTRCTPCDDSGPNVVGVRCTDEQCVLDCADGFSDCDGDAPNGCEVAYMGDDSGNCGGCGIDCGYGECVEGECDNKVVAFSAGPTHNCAQLADTTFWCWGNNDAGQLGLPTSTGSSNVPVQVELGTGSVGSFWRFTPLDDDTTYLVRFVISPAGPSNLFYALGRDPRSDSATLAEPTRLFLTIGFSVIDVGGGALLELESGRPSGGTAPFALFGLGDPSSDAFSTWAPPSGGRIDRTQLTTWSGERGEGLVVARGDRESCVMYPDDGTLRCWGTAGPSGEPAYIGDGTTTGSATPVVVRPSVPGNHRFSARPGGVDIGHGLACAAFEPAGVGLTPTLHYCWGDWSCGDLDSLEPQPLPGALTAAAIPSLSVGRRAACTVETLSGRVYCWGDDMLGGACHETAAEPFPEVRDAISVQLGRRHGCFLRRAGASTGGTLYCWGSDDVGQLGAGPAAGSGPHQVVFSTPPMSGP